MIIQARYDILENTTAPSGNSDVSVTEHEFNNLNDTIAFLLVAC